MLLVELVHAGGAPRLSDGAIAADAKQVTPRGKANAVSCHVDGSSTRNRCMRADSLRKAMAAV
jgi:hypothetical protein